MKIRNLLLFGALMMLCLSCDNKRSSEPCSSSESAVTAQNVNLQFWMTYTNEEIYEYITPALYNAGNMFAEEKDVENPFEGRLFGGYGGVLLGADSNGKAAIDEFIAWSDKMECDALPKELRLCWGVAPKNGMYELYAIKDESNNAKAPLEGDIIEKAEVVKHPNSNAPLISVKMNDCAAATWADMTERCANESRHIAIVVDGLVYSAPLPVERITCGESVISGDFTMEQARELVAGVK